MKKISYLLASLFLLPFHTIAQSPDKEQKTPAFGISFSGYVKTDLFFDSRQTVNLREGHFLLFPENEKPDADGVDINAKGSFNILSVQTRLAGAITGPDALGAKTSGYIEGEFFGNINTAINSFRLRHAWIKLNWKTTELMAGQWWHPMFVPECSPATVSFNTGAPFVVFSRNPQIKLSQSIGHFKASLTFLSQVDFVSDGPEGTSPKYLRNSMLPETNFTLQYASKNDRAGLEFLTGAGVNYQLLTPRLSSTVTGLNTITLWQTDVTSSGWAGNVFTKIKCNPVTFKAGLEYGDNNNAYTMIGGYVVKSVTDTAKGFVNYANIRSFAAWGEIHSNGARWQPGVFGAFSRNLGAGETVKGPWYVRGANIDYAYRISPRLIFNAKKLRIAAEVEYTVAAYGKTTTKGYVIDSKEVGNWRLLMGIYYFF